MLNGGNGVYNEVITTDHSHSIREDFSTFGKILYKPPFYLNKTQTRVYENDSLTHSWS
jgi:hypothetical protein